VRAVSIAVSYGRSYAVADTDELWVWGVDSDHRCATPLGHGERMSYFLPKLVESLRGVKVDAVANSSYHTLALADDTRVYSWGAARAAGFGALGLGPSVQAARRAVRKPRPVPALRAGGGGEGA
jgi:alpha-tubulin suppressor-like RCC1 family protein